MLKEWNKKNPRFHSSVQSYCKERLCAEKCIFKKDTEYGMEKVYFSDTFLSTHSNIYIGYCYGYEKSTGTSILIFVIV